MSSKSKAKGTRAETNVRRFIEERCTSPIRVNRRALAGSKDEGDLLVETLEDDGITTRSSFIVEVKAGKQTENPSRRQIEEWCRQANEEADNATTSNLWPEPVLVVVRYRRKLKDADVYIPAHNVMTRYWREHMYLDEFVDHIDW